MKSWGFLHLLREEAGSNGVRLLAVAGISGASNAFLVSIIIKAAQNATPGELSVQEFALFAICLTLFAVTRIYTLTQTGVLTERVVSNVRLRIIEKIRHSDLSLLEKVGQSRIYTALTENTNILSQSAFQLSNAFSSVVMLFFVSIYIMLISKTAFFLTLVFSAGSIYVYAANRKKVEDEILEASRREDTFFELLTHLLDGFKEVKLNASRNEDLYQNHIKTTSHSARDLKISTNRKLANLVVFGISFIYCLAATIVFVLPVLSPGSVADIGTIAAAVLFIMGPLNEVAGVGPVIMRTNVAVGNIQVVEGLLDVIEDSPKDLLHELAPPPPFESLELRDVVFSYPEPNGNGGGDAFKIGPINLKVEKGEILFIVGGNGSGKSTLLKVLTGLYPPQSGEIIINGGSISHNRLPFYRRSFSTVFSDFHLFDRLYGIKEYDEATLQELLRTMVLDSKTSVTDGVFSNIKLSTGQKKRLAVIVSLMEARPVQVFDEVAADQDPEFRKRYYREFLQKWRGEEGKTIIAATHDDHFFDCADRVLEMEYGQLKPWTPS